MREILIVIGLLLLAFALRTARTNLLRKLGAIMFLVTSFAFFYFITGSFAIGILGAGLWFLLPWVELLTRVRNMRLPMENRLRQTEPPNPSFFPNAIEAAAAMDEAGFDHVTDCGWEWAGMQQYFRLFWHPEERAIAAVCLCEHSNVAFAFISIASRDCNGRLWRTTNFPFSPMLRFSPDVRWNHVPCEKSCFHQILTDHKAYLRRMNVSPDDLRVPDPENIEADIEKEMREQVAHNLRSGIILADGDTHFRYSPRGLFFLWGQFIKDMVRLC